MLSHLGQKHPSDGPGPRQGAAVSIDELGDDGDDREDGPGDAGGYEGEESSHDENAVAERRRSDRKRLREHAGDSSRYSDDRDDREPLEKATGDSDSSFSLRSERSGSNDGEDADGAAGMGPPVALLPVPQPVLGAAVPIDTGIHARRKVATPPCGLTMTEKVIGGLIYEHVSNSAGDQIIAAIKRPDFVPSGER